MADLARHRRLCRALRGSPLQRLGLLAISCSLLLEHPAISCSLLLKHPARYLILSPAPSLGGRRRGPALVAEWARGAIVAARRVVEDAERSFTIMREWARSAVSAAALGEENAACSGGHRRGAASQRRMLSLELGLLPALARCPRKLEFFRGWLMEQEPPSVRLQCLRGPRTSREGSQKMGALLPSVLPSLACFASSALDAVSLRIRGHRHLAHANVRQQPPLRTAAVFFNARRHRREYKKGKL